MATFSSPERALAAALRMRGSIAAGQDTRREDLILKIGIHEARALPSCSMTGSIISARR